jgi:hypothetical protein
MVMVNNRAKMRWVRDIHIPPQSIHSIFINMDKHPLADLVETTSLPNGSSPRTDNLMHCNPKGIPIMVIHNSTPPMRYSKKIKIPPPRNIHRRLPIVLIFSPGLIRLNSVKNFYCNRLFDNPFGHIYSKVKKTCCLIRTVPVILMV